jgi:hypothetical protein
MEHSPTSATGTAWERTPWHAVQVTAQIALLQTLSELVDLGLALIAGGVVGIVLIGAWIKRGRW